jgi:hypothetical protein
LIFLSLLKWLPSSACRAATFLLWNSQQYCEDWKNPETRRKFWEDFGSAEKRLVNFGLLHQLWARLDPTALETNPTNPSKHENVRTFIFVNHSHAFLCVEKSL